MNGRFTTALALGLTLLGCGGAQGPDVAPCLPLDGSKPTGPNAEAQAWLDGHNLVRSGCAATISPAPHPALPLLEWSATAAAKAQAWANGCKFEHNPDLGQFGENIAASPKDHWPTPIGAVELWASEWSNYSYATNTCAAGKKCGHYTQLVWRSTLRVGCGRATCTTGSPLPSAPDWDVFVCDYEPPGNYTGQRPY